MVSGSGGLALHATAALDPARADWIIVPGASGPLSTDDADGTDEDGPANPTVPVLLAARSTPPCPG